MGQDVRNQRGVQTWWSLWTYVLVDQDDANVLPFLCKSYKSLLDLLGLGLVVNDKEIPLRIWRVCDMAYTSKEYACDRTGHGQFVHTNSGETAALESNRSSALPGHELTVVSLFITDNSQKLSVLGDN